MVYNTVSENVNKHLLPYRTIDLSYILCYIVNHASMPSSMFRSRQILVLNVISR